jgi:hypothetical protein
MELKERFGRGEKNNDNLEELFDAGVLNLQDGPLPQIKC